MARKVDIYTYTAAVNPFFVKSLATKYGYTFDADQRLDTVLRQLVAFEGEQALMEIIENNPDYDLMKDYFQKKLDSAKPTQNAVVDSSRVLDQYMNFTGQLAAVQQTAENRQLTQNTSLMVLAGAVLIAFAIISTKK